MVNVYGPRNTYLLDSLLSGFSFKYELTSSAEMYGCLEEGFEAPHGSESELLVVGTCIQLLLHGSRITRDGFYQWQAGYIAKKLKAHKIAETVKHLHANEVLEVLILFILSYIKETD